MCPLHSVDEAERCFPSPSLSLRGSRLPKGGRRLYADRKRKPQADPRAIWAVEWVNPPPERGGLTDPIKDRGGWGRQRMRELGFTGERRLHRSITANPRASRS